MFQPEMTRRDWLRAGMLGSCGSLAGWIPFDFCLAQPPAKPGSLTITKVETFLLRHKLPRAIGVSIALSDLRQSLLVKISTDSGLVGWGETSDVGGTRAVIETSSSRRSSARTRWSSGVCGGRCGARTSAMAGRWRRSISPCTTCAARRLGQSVADMYGGRVRDKVLAYASAMNYTDGVRPEDTIPGRSGGTGQARLSGDEDSHGPLRGPRAIWPCWRRFAKRSAPTCAC